MSATGYFVRARGKITGPFDVSALQKLVRRGLLSRMHELSPDRQSWSCASDFEELFPIQAELGAAAPASQTSSAHVGTGQQPYTAPATMFTYVQSGRTIGPVAASVLQSLASNGTLRDDDLVWAEGDQSAVRAAQLAILAPIFSVTMGSPGSLRSSLTDADRQQISRAIAHVSSIAMLSAIVIGFLILLCLNLPAGSRNGVTEWWWHVYRRPQNGTSVVLLTFVLIAGMVAMVVGAATSGLLRGWTLIVISGFSFLLLLVLGLISSDHQDGPMFSLMIPYLAAALLGMTYCRGIAPQSRSVALFQGISGGVLLFFAFIVGVVWLTQRPLVELRPLLSGDELPGWLIIALIISALGMIALLLSGILGLVSLRARYSRAVNTTLVVSTVCSLALPCCAFIIGLCGFVNVLKVDRPGLMIFLCIRALVIILALVALMAVGTLEVFAMNCLRTDLVAHRRHREATSPI